MSSETNLRVVARALAVSRVCSALQVPVDTEAALQRFGESLRTLSLSTTGRTLSAVTRKLPEATAHALQTLAGDRFAEARTLMADAGRDRFAAARARDELAAAVEQAQHAFQATSRQLLADDVVRFALANGGTAESCSGPNVTAVAIAAGDHRTGVVRIVEGGSMDIEWQGLNGTTCRDWTAALTADLVAKGWDATVEHEDFHGGGPGDGERLIRPAAARDPESLARGVVAIAEEELQHRDRPARRSWYDEDEGAADLEGELA